MELKGTLNKLKSRLASVSDTSALDTLLLAAHTLGQPKAWILAHPEYQLNEQQRLKLEESALRLESGEPLPYVLGEWEFYGLGMQITPVVLIPRPETELLVEQATTWGRNRAAVRLVDIGTGSGCIAASLGVHLPRATITAVDLSGAALRVARVNLERHGVLARASLVQADLLSAFLSHSFDLICANLPYIPTSSLHSLPVYGREPTLALDGGSDGLDLIRRLLLQAQSCLAPQGLLLFEIESSQGNLAMQLAQAAFPTAAITLLQDLSNQDRLVRVQLPASMV